MSKNRLRLVVSNNEYHKGKDKHKNIIEKLKDSFFCLFISKEEKIYILKDFLIKIYRDYEISTGYKDVPYYIRADIKMSKIIQERKINYYYRLFRRLNNK